MTAFSRNKTCIPQKHWISKMSETTKASLQVIRPEAALAAAQNSAACWSRAISRLAEGFMSAAKMQTELTYQMFATTELTNWLLAVTPDTANEVTHQWFASKKAKRDVLLNGYLQINDDLTASFYAAANDLAEGLNFTKNSKSESPDTATKADSLKAIALLEKRTAAA